MAARPGATPGVIDGSQRHVTVPSAGRETSRKGPRALVERDPADAGERIKVPTMPMAATFRTPRPRRSFLARHIERTSDRERFGHSPLGSAVPDHDVHLVHPAVEEDLRGRPSAREALKARPASGNELLQRSAVGLLASRA
jgi:hypothetical protein